MYHLPTWFLIYQYTVMVPCISETNNVLSVLLGYWVTHRKQNTVVNIDRMHQMSNEKFQHWLEMATFFTVILSESVVKLLSHFCDQ